MANATLVDMSLDRKEIQTDSYFSSFVSIAVWTLWLANIFVC